jgi:hypothetical protein
MKGRAMDKLTFPIVGVMGPVSNGQSVHPGLITSSDTTTAGLIDNAVLPDELDEAGVMTGNKLPMPGLVGRANVQIFPDLQAPHPAAGLALFDSFESAEACFEAYAAKNMKFVCAYHMHEEVEIQKAMDEMRAEMDAQAARLSEIYAQHFPEEKETADV